MLTFLGFHPTMCSDFPFFAFVTGLGTDMRHPASPERDVRENGDFATELRLRPASNLTTVAAEGRLAEVPSSPSPLALQPVQLPDGSALAKCVTSTMPSSPSLVPDLCLAPVSIDEDVQDTALPDLALLYEPERLKDAVGALEDHTSTVDPQLAPIPEETTEDDVEEDTRATLPQPSSITASNTTPSALPKGPFTAGQAAWIPPPAPSISTQLPPQEQTTPPSFIETQSNASHASPISSGIPSYSEDLGDSSSVASTNGDGSSVFDDYHSDTTSYTASLLSDVKNYAYENGRRYHSYREGHYVLPNDEQEQDRQDLLHHVRNLVLNGALFRAPVGKNIQRALDLGTGTGIWAIDFADTFPSAEVIGTDLSPIQPSWVPPNLRFLVDDAESPWLYSAARPFDFIHARDLGGAIANWPRLLRQAYGHLRPGGWVELQEFEVTLRSDDETLRLAPTLCEFLGRLHEASEAFHRPMNIAEGHRQRLVEAGFEDIRDEVYKVRRDLPG